MPEDPLLSFLAEPTPTTVEEVPYSTWSQENIFENPIESYSKYMDHIREQYVDAGEYNADIEKSITQNFYGELVRQNLVDPNNLDDFKNVDAQIRGFDLPDFDDQVENLYKEDLVRKGYRKILEEEEREIFKNYLAAVNAGEEVDEDQQKLVKETFRENRNQILKQQYIRGEINAAVLEDEEGNFNFFGGHVPEGKSYMDVIRESQLQGTGVRLSDLPNLINSQKKLASYKNLSRAEAMRLASIEGEVLSTLKKDELLKIKLDGLSRSRVESEDGFWDNTKDVAEGGLNVITGFALGLGEMAATLFGAEDAVKSINEIQGSREIASKIRKFSNNANSTRDSLIADLAIQTGASTEDVAKVVDQISLDQADFKFYDGDDLNLNIREGIYKQPKIHSSLLHQPKLLDKAIAQADLGPEIAESMRASREIYAIEDFQRVNELLQADGDTADDWNEYYLENKRQGLDDHKILENFAETYDFNSFIDKTEGVFYSLYSGTIGTASVVIGAIAGAEGLKNYGVEVINNEQKRRQVGGVFGVEYGSMYDLATTAVPMVTDMAATVFLSKFTGGVGGALYAGAKASSLSAVRSVAKNFVKGNLRAVGGETYKEVAQKLFKDGAIKNIDDAYGIVKNYNSVMAQRIGAAPAVFIPAAHRSGAHTYAAVNTLMTEKLTQDHKNADGTWQDGWSEERVKKEAHEKGMSGMFFGGAFTGFLTAGFGLVGKGGFETALLRGASYRQLKQIGQDLTNREISNVAFKDQLVKSVKTALAKHGTDGLRALGSGVLSEGIEESVDEFANSLIQDIITNESTPMMEVLNQTFHAFFLGGLLGGGGVAINRVAKTVAPNRFLDKSAAASFESEILEQYQKDVQGNKALIEAGAPQTAEAAAEALSQYARAEPSAEEQAEKIIEPIAEDAAAEESANLNSDLNNLDREDVENAVNTELEESERNKEPVDPEVASSEEAQGIIKENGLDVDTALGKILKPHFAPSPQEVQESYSEKEKEIKKRAEAWVIINRIEDPAKRKRAMTSAKELGFNPLSPSQAKAALNKLKKQTERDLKAIEQAEKDGLTESDMNIVETLASEGVSKSLNQSTLKELDVKPSKSDPAFIKLLEKKVKQRINAKYPTRSVRLPQGGYEIPRDKGKSTLKVQSNGVGVFNNDPESMITLLQLGIPVEVDNVTEKTNPAFKWEQKGNKFILRDVMVRDSGGMVSAATPNNNVAVLEEDFSQLIDDAKRLNELNQTDNPNLDVQIRSPFDKRRKATVRDLIEVAKDPLELKKLLAKSNKKVDDLDKPFFDSAVTYLSVQLQLRFRNYAEALGQGLVVDLNFTANSVASDVVENLYKQQQARKDFQVRATVESIDTDRTNKVDLDQDVDRTEVSEDNYVPVNFSSDPSLKDPSVIKRYLQQQEEVAAEALNSDPEMAQALRDAMAEAGHGYANKLSGEGLFAAHVSELARTGTFNKQKSIYQFHSRLKAGEFTQGKALSDSLFFLNLSHKFNRASDQDPISKKQAATRVKEKLESITGKKILEPEAVIFYTQIKKQINKFLQRAVADKRSRKAVEAANESEVEELGLRDGSPDHVIKALEKISKGKNKVQAIIARVLLHNRALLKTIDFTLEKSSATYAGKYLVNNEGKGNVVINLSRTGGRGIADTLLHEYIHAFSSRITQLDPSQRTTAENNAIARLEGLLKIIRKQAAADKAPASIQSGLVNVDEFISYFLTSPKFQGYIKSMTLREGRSFFDRIIDAIARLFRQPTNEREYNAALRDVLDITKRGMLVREPDTSAGFRNQVADGVEQSQKERDEISKLIGLEADLRDLQMLDEKGAELEVFVGNYVPSEVAVFSNNSIPTIARWNPQTQSIEFNGRRAAAFINEALSNNGGYPINEEQVIAAIINEELAHAASFASLSQSSIDSLINSLDEAESKRIIEEYYPEDEQADALKRLESDNPQVVENQKYILVEEMLRMFFQKKTRGTTTESEVAFLIEAPENLEVFKQYLKNTFKRLSYHKEQKDISPEMRNALKRVLNEVRRMEGGYRTRMNGMYFDASNPNATINQLIDQLSRNKSIDSLDEDDIAPDLETKIGSTAIITAPLRVDELKNLSKQQMVKRAESAKYIHLQQAFDDIANAYNLSIDTRSPLIGGYLEEGQLSTEVPERVFVEGATEQELKDIGLLTKVLAPEIQHSTLLVQYVDEGTQGQEIEIRIKAKGAEKARLMGEDWLKDKNAGGFSFDPTTREIYTLLLNPFSEGDPSVDEQLNTWNTFVDEQKQKGNIFKNAVSETSYVSAEFVGGTSEEVRGEVQRIRDQASEENNTALLEVSERALNRIDQDIKGEKIKQRAIDVLAKRDLSPLSSTKVAEAAEGKKFETIRDFGKFADDRLESIEGVRQLSEQADEGIDDRAAKAARPLVDDVLIGLSQSGSGMGWYDARVEATLHELTKIYPELAEDQNELAIFVGILATTSQGEPVVTNFKNASRVYEDYKATGRISDDYNFGKEKGAINLNLKFMQDLIDRYQKETGLGKEYFREFMDSEILGGALRDMFGDTPSGVTLSDKVVGARMLGPKIGSFFNNLRGRFDTITMDLWYTRTMHRYIGNSVLENDSEQALNAKEKFINALRNSERTYDLNPDELEAMDFEGIYAAAKKVFNVWSSGSLPEAQGKTYKTYSDNSKFEKAARTVTTVSGMKAAPKKKSYSLFFERIVREAQSQLKDLGFDLNAADIQAILWFREKNLFLGLGLANSAAAPADYLDAAMVLRREKAQEVDEQTEEPISLALETRFGAGKFPSDHTGLNKIVVEDKIGGSVGIPKGREGEKVKLSHTNITLGRKSREGGSAYDPNYPVGVMPYSLQLDKKYNAFNVRLKDVDDIVLQDAPFDKFLNSGQKYELETDMDIEDVLSQINTPRKDELKKIPMVDFLLMNPELRGKEKIPAGTVVYAQGAKQVVGGPAGTLVSYNEDIKDVAAEGIYINDSTQKFTDQILKGDKTVETRNKPTLDRFIGQRVGIIRSGRGKSVVVGYATIGDRIDYPTEKSFRADEKRHKVKKGSKFDTKGVKYGYELLDVAEEPNPYGVVESKSRQHALIAHSIAYNPASSNYMYPVYGTKDGPVFEVNKEFVGADEVIMISDLGKQTKDEGINFMLVARGARFKELTDQEVEEKRSSNIIINRLEDKEAIPLGASIEAPAFAPSTEINNKNVLDKLNREEINQLGKKRMSLKTGNPIAGNVISKENLAKIWKQGFEKSKARYDKAKKRLAENGVFIPELTIDRYAPTPASTLELFKLSDIAQWHLDMADFVIPESYDTIAFVPCAASKPWCGVTDEKTLYSKERRKLYPSYNRIREMFDKGAVGKNFKRVYFVTVSEPLGVVPQDRWHNFPAYDNSGLFTNVSQQSGFSTKQWLNLSKEKGGTGTKQLFPFDEKAYKKAIGILGEVISNFIQTNKQNNPDLKVISFVRDNGDKGSHELMLDAASEFAGETIVSEDNNFAKRQASGTSPEVLLKKVLGLEGRVEYDPNFEVDRAEIIARSPLPTEPPALETRFGATALSIDPEKESRYLKAAEDDDIITTNKLLGEEAIRKGHLVEGELVKVFHGSTQMRMRAFDKKFIRRTAAGGFGFYFAGKKNATLAYNYADEQGGRTYPVFLKANKVFEVDGNHVNAIGNSEVFFEELGEGLSARYNLTEEEINSVRDNGVPIMYLIQSGMFKTRIKQLAEENPKFQEIQEDMEAMGLGGATQMVSELSGYDAVHYKEDDVWIVYQPEQIKSAEVTRDDFGDVIPLSRRFDEGPRILNTRFGASSYIPKSIGEADLDFSAMFESLDIPILEYGTFEQPSSRLKKALSGSTDRQVRRFVEERDAFVQTSKKIVKQFKDKFDADIERIENDKNVNIPKSLIARATGSTVGSQLSQDQLDDVSDKFEKDIKAARKIADKSTREAAFIAAEEQRRKNITDYRQQNRDRLLEDRDKALKELSEVTDNSPDVVQLIINARAFMDELSKKGNDLFSDYLSDFDVQATFDGNLGIYITRRYRMFEDDAFADRVLTDPEYASVRDAALKFFSKIYFNQQVQYHILEGGMTRKVAKEMAMQDLTDANAMTVTPMQTMMEDFVKGYKRGDIAGGLRTFVGANQEEQLAINNTTNISKPLKAYLDQIKKKHDVPVELRNLLGEVTGEESGLDNLLVSIVSTSSMMANQAMLNKMAHYGMQGDTPWMVSATDILNEKEAAAAEGRKSKYDGWVPIRKSQGAMDWNPVSDMYVEQEVYEGIKEIFEKPKQEEATLFFNQLYRGLQQATGISLAAKTLGSVGFYIRNMASNGMYFGPMQGYYGGIGLGMKEAGAVLGGISHIDRLNGPVGDYVKGLKEDSMLVRAYRGSRATMDAELEFLASQNVWGDEVQAEVIRDFVEGKTTRNEVNQKIEEIAAQVKKLAPNGVHKVPSKAAKSVKSLTDFATRLASASDAYYKIGYYHFELGHLVEAANQDPPNGKYRKLLNEDGTPSTEMKKMAALKVKRTAQAYSQAPPIIREATNSPVGLFVGSYIRFAGETVRIPFNTWQLSKEEVADDNPVIQARGRARRRGMMIVLGGLTVVLPQMMRMIVGNLDLDEEESLRNTMPEFLRRHTFLYTTFGKGLQSWDLTYLNPFSSITDGFVRGAEHFIKGNFAKGMESILIDTFRPFTEEQILASAVLQAVQNKNQYDKPIYYEDDPVIEKFGKMFGHVLGGAFGLRTVQKLNETQIALRGDGEGFLNSPLGIIAAEFAPVKPHQVDLQRNIRNFLNQKAKEYRDITTKFNRLYQDKAMTTGQINDLYSDIQNSRRRLNETIFETMENFESIGRKHGGIRRSDIERQAKITGMSKERYRLGRMGYMKTLRPSPSQKKKLDESILGRSRSNQLKQLQREFGDTIPLDN